MKCIFSLFSCFNDKHVGCVSEIKVGICQLCVLIQGKGKGINNFTLDSCIQVFLRVQLLPFPVLPGTHYSWIGWSNLSEVSFSRKQNYQSYLTFPIYKVGSIGAMWVKILLNEAIAKNSTIHKSNQDLLDHRPIQNHCCCCPTRI